LEQAGNWYKIRLNNGVEAYLVATYSGLSTLKKGCPPSVSTPKDSAKTTVLVPVMIEVKGGTFQMGSNDYDNEKPIHAVILSDFSIGKFEVTVEQYMQFANETKTHYPEWLEEGNEYTIKTGKETLYKDLGDALQNPTNPIVGISWNDATAYCQWLSSKTGKKYRLPTESEWEYAAHGGNKSRGFTYSGSNTVGDVAWYSENSDSKTHAVGGKQANELGLYDMSGNVWEWCSDRYSETYISTAASNPTGAVEGSYRVFRGGSWISYPQSCRASYRNSSTPTYRYRALGFRLALSFQ
jgi:formylglycine-generating enzyme